MLKLQALYCVWIVIFGVEDLIWICHSTIVDLSKNNSKKKRKKINLKIVRPNE